MIIIIKLDFQVMQCNFFKRTTDYVKYFERFYLCELSLKSKQTKKFLLKQIFSFNLNVLNKFYPFITIYDIKSICLLQVATENFIYLFEKMLLKTHFSSDHKKYTSLINQFKDILFLSIFSKIQFNFLYCFARIKN